MKQGLRGYLQWRVTKSFNSFEDETKNYWNYEELNVYLLSIPLRMKPFREYCLKNRDEIALSIPLRMKQTRRSSRSSGKSSPSFNSFEDETKPTQLHYMHSVISTFNSFEDETILFYKVSLKPLKLSIPLRMKR